MSENENGPLHGIRVIEMAGIGPAPFAAMILADLGADVIRVDRPVSGEPGHDPGRDVVNRGKRSIIADLKTAEGRSVVLKLVASADVLIEGLRPGVMERLRLGPSECAQVNPGLIYGRMTGWGQIGPLANRAGHDINYVAITGVLWAMGRKDERPVPPLNLVGDYGGGSMFLIVGVLAALLERQRSGMGQIIDAAMVDGTAALAALFSTMRATGEWKDQRASNILDSGAPFYEVYECADGKYFATGAVEPQFYEELVRRTNFRPDDDDETRVRPPAREDWAEDKARWEKLFKTRTRDEWAAILADSDACAQPVLDWDEAQRSHHLVARKTYFTMNEIVQPSPAPRFSRTPGGVRRPPPRPGEHTDEVLGEIGLGS